MVSSYNLSYSQAFLSRPALRMQRRMAFGIAVLMLTSMLSLVPVAKFYMVASPSFLPMFYVAMFLCNGFTSLLLGLQAIHLRHATLAILAGAFTFTCATAFLQIFMSPYVTGNEFHLFQETSQGLAWLGWIGRLAFPIFVMVAINQSEHERASWVLLSFWGFPAILAGLLLIGLSHENFLPPLLKGGTELHQWSEFLTKGIIPAHLLLICSAVIMLARKSRFRTRLHLWLGVALVGIVAESIVAMVSGSRFTLGWYGALAFHLMTVLILLGALFWDIHDMQGTLQRLNAQLHKQANHDNLTGLLLRRPFNDILQKALIGEKKQQIPPLLIMIDVDDFKAYNDTFGHLSGDSCLIAISHALNKKVQEFNGCIARMGGEEIAVIFTGDNALNPQKMADMLRKEVEQLHLQHSPKAHFGWVTISLGWATGNARSGMSEWLKKADEALYAAKNAGRNQATGYPFIPKKTCHAIKLRTHNSQRHERKNRQN